MIFLATKKVGQQIFSPLLFCCCFWIRDPRYGKPCFSPCFFIFLAYFSVNPGSGMIRKVGFRSESAILTLGHVCTGTVVLIILLLNLNQRNNFSCRYCYPVLWIHEILVRIRIRRSIPLTNGAGLDPEADPDPAIFVNDLQDVNKKLLFFSKYFCLLLFESTFHHFSKTKSHKEVTKQ